MRHTFFTLALLLVIVHPLHAQDSYPPVPINSPASPQAPGPEMPAPLVIPPTTAQTMQPLPMPFPALPAVQLDDAHDAVGAAQKLAREKKLQGRVLWVDATANLGRYNTVESIHDLVVQAKRTGFNTIVVDVKPFIGYTTYPSHIAPKIADWKGARMPQDFDPLAAFVREGHNNGIQICANLAVFAEGHKVVGKGIGYQDTSMQTVLYEATRSIRAPVLYSPSYTLSDNTNALSADASVLSVYTDASSMRRAISGALAIVTDASGHILAEVEGDLLGTVSLSVPSQGAILLAQGSASDSLRATTRVGETLDFTSTPHYVPIADDPSQKITLFVNPNDPAVQERELSLVKEVVTNYEVDGIVFDDRLRFAGINADFSDLSMKRFEEYIGHSIKWPDDVFRYSPFPNQDTIKGPLYSDWVVWRALTIRNWLAKARAVVKFYRPHASLGIYAGSWYGEYGELGENWAADDFAGAFDFNTSEWRKTGFAGLLDWMTTGCYYSIATVAEGAIAGSRGATVEGAGQLSNRAVNDQTWVYAGLYAIEFSGRNDNFARALQAAAASTQGVMVFDVSQVTDNGLWPILAQAFNESADPPHKDPALIDTLRSQRAGGGTAPQASDAPGKAGTGL